MKVCETCGAEYGKRKSEAYWQFEIRRYCSRPCADKGRGVAQRVADEEYKGGYRQVTTPDGRKIGEHRWVMEQVIGRPLEHWEQVHHKNHNGLDNRPENLELVSSAEHGERHTRHPVTKTCVICGNEFTPHKTKRVRQQICSPACKTELMIRRQAERKAIEMNCDSCGKSFQGTSQQKTCSPKCRNRRTTRLRQERRQQGE
jgi:HNH endonuclease